MESDGSVLCASELIVCIKCRMCHMCSLWELKEMVLTLFFQIQESGPANISADEGQPAHPSGENW